MAGVKWSDERRYQDQLRRLQNNVVRAEEDLAEARKVYEKTNVESREASLIHKAWAELDVAKDQLRRARLNLGDWEGKMAAEDERLKLMEPPSFQQLVLDHAVYDDTGKMIGGYDRITPEAWAKFDKAMAEWKAKIRYGEFPPKRI
jgi:hypothetical protein